MNKGKKTEEDSQQVMVFSRLRHNVDEMITVFILAMMIRSFVICPFKIPTGSMEPTLHGDRIHGDRIFAIRYPYYFRTPKRGEIVVFKTINIPGHDGTKDFIKRLVGLPGEKLYIKDGRIYINDEIVDSPEIFKKLEYTFDRRIMRYGDPENPIVIPKGHYFVLGDNTRNSSDGRFWGFVPVENFKGRAVLTFWPIWPRNRFTVLK